MSEDEMTFSHLIAGLMDPQADHQAVREAWRRGALARDQQQRRIAQNVAAALSCELTSAKTWGHCLSAEYRLTHPSTGNQFSIWGPDTPTTDTEVEDRLMQQIRAKLLANC